jgi:hypothetical protein
VDNRCWRSMSTSIRICSYLLLPLIYLLVNVKIAQLGESFPITIVTFLPVLLLLFLERISVKKLMIAKQIAIKQTKQDNIRHCSHPRRMFDDLRIVLMADALFAAFAVTVDKM